MTPFNPCFTDNVTTTDDIMFFMLIAFIWFGVSIFILAFDDMYLIWKHRRMRKVNRQQYQFPKYLEDDDE